MKCCAMRYSVIMLAMICTNFLSCTSAQQPAKPSPKPAWERIGPGGGGTTLSPVFHPTDPNRMWVRCDMSGDYVTRDGGKSWDIHNFKGGGTLFAFDPANSDRMFVGGDFLHRTSDGGKTWQMVLPRLDQVQSMRQYGDHADFEFTVKKDFALGQGSVDAICIDAVDPRFMVVGWGKRIVFSTDGADTWTSAGETDANASFIYQTPEAAGQFLIFAGSSVYSFSKTTRTFTKRAVPIEGPFAVTGGFNPQTRQSCLYALTGSPRNRSGVSKVMASTDRGQTWKEPAMKLPEEFKGSAPRFSKLVACLGDGRTLYMICTRLAETYGTPTPSYWHGILKSSNGGQDWAWVYKARGGNWEYADAAHNYRAKPGFEAQNLKDGWVAEAFNRKGDGVCFEYNSIFDVGVCPGDPNAVVFTDLWRTIRSDDGGKNWHEAYGELQPDGSSRSRGTDVTTTYGVHFDPFDRNHMFISWTDIALHSSSNSGKNWLRSINGIPPHWDNTCYWLVFDPEIKGKIWSVWSSRHDFPRFKMTRNANWRDSAAGGVCLSTDGGTNWSVTSQSLTDHAPSTCIVLDPTSPKNNRTLYVTVYGFGVAKSTDDGKTWAYKNKGLPEQPHAFEIVRQPDGRLFVVITPKPAVKDGKLLPEVVRGSVYTSTDGAETWTKVNIPSTVCFPNSITYDPSNPKRLYLASWGSFAIGDILGASVAREIGPDTPIRSDGGVFMSEDGGNTWTRVFSEKEYVYSVAVDPRIPGRVYLNGFSYGAYQSNDYGKTWAPIPGYDFYWGQRAILDPYDKDKIYLTTFGSSVWHGPVR